ncbi:fasciclin domain-containing protein [Marseilla massiliensis]|uniref:fasciclin domain-containing protein n=1 Tax=Marseilla massiliensis TaxID=1841864 RepID=UPI0020131BEC|nr:fasciclin domain-containing protein [Marseilla massiliensis]MCL1609975.1 fasciclin domain-containing protein [Marseilla massiliensis]
MENSMKRLKYIFVGVVCALTGMATVSCSDEPDDENFYTFTGEMMSDYFRNRPEYSDFAYIVDQAGMTDLLSAYGHYTCFLPSNKVVENYLNKKGLNSVKDLTLEQCDTIARTHLVNNMYATIDMNDGTLNTANMNKRYIQITHTVDKNDNSVVQLNRMSNIIFELKDDSVENGIIHPIDVLLENSNSSISDVLKANDRIRIFYEGLVATGLRDTLIKTKDESYDGSKYGTYSYTSDFWREIAVAPEEKKYGFTVFVEPDDLYEKKFKEYGISTSNGMVRALYDLACMIYDPVFADDDDYKAAYGFDKITDRNNPLNMFMAYHILTRDVIGWNKLTPIEVHSGIVDGAIGIKIDKMNPCDWYETLMPRTMMKLEQATVREYMGNSERGQRYINRRVDDKFSIDGSKIQPTVEADYLQDAPNGRYFYIDDIIAFNKDTQEKVLNDRIRMDFSTIFPEVMTMNMRLNGDPTKDDESSKADQTFKNGKNYWFPKGYLDNVTMEGNGVLVYRRPHWNFWSYEGDEFNLFGDYDFTFRLPPVPYEGEYQIRLGFCALDTRGVAQIYFDGKPQGIPVDMRKRLSDETILGDQFGTKKWADMTDEEKAEDQKMLKNLGYYRGAYGGYHSSGSTINEFVDNPRTYRLVLCTVHINPKKDHYIRVRCTSSSKLGNNNEFMMDYLEIVPKSVYGISSSGAMETDL